MTELESLLSDIPLEEREEALQYYNGYFEDAGEEQEQEIIKELGSPEKVAQIIKAALNTGEADNGEQGYYTEHGYQSTVNQEKRYEMVGSGNRMTGSSQNRNDSNRASGSANGNNSAGQTNNSSDSNSQQGTANTDYGADNAAGQHERNTRLALIILVCIVASPVILPVIGTVIGLIAAIIGVIIGCGIAGIAMIICGIALFIVGLLKIAVPFMGMLFCGSGLVVFGIGMLLTLACVILCKNVLPAFIKWIINICRKPFQNRSVAA